MSHLGIAGFKQRECLCVLINVHAREETFSGKSNCVKQSLLRKQVHQALLIGKQV